MGGTLSTLKRECSGSRLYSLPQTSLGWETVFANRAASSGGKFWFSPRSNCSHPLCLSKTPILCIFLRESRNHSSPAIGIQVEVLGKNDRMIMSALDRGAPPDDAALDVVVIGPDSLPVFDLVRFGI